MDIFKRLGVLVAIMGMFGSVLGFFYAIFDKINHNTASIERLETVHSKDIDSINNYLRWEQAACEERRKAINDRVDHVEEECSRLEDRLNDGK